MTFRHDNLIPQFEKELKVFLQQQFNQDSLIEYSYTKPIPTIIYFKIGEIQINLHDFDQYDSDEIKTNFYLDIYNKIMFQIHFFLEQQMIQEKVIPFTTMIREINKGIWSYISVNCHNFIGDKKTMNGEIVHSEKYKLFNHNTSDAFIWKDFKIIIQFEYDFDTTYEKNHLILFIENMPTHYKLRDSN